MLHPNVAAADTANPAPAAEEIEDAITVDTQFGPMTFSHDTVITFPNGLLGFGGSNEFGLANLPDPALGNFKLMQCLDGSGLGFLVLPLDSLPDHIHEDDVTDALKALSIEPGNALVLLIVTVRKTEERAVLTANLRAPVIIDAEERKAVQYVMSNNAYPIQHEL